MASPLLFIFLSLALAGGKPVPQSDEDVAIQKLKSIEQDIRSRASEADEQVKKAKQESRKITSDAEAEAKRIRKEADDYAKKTQREIQDIQKGTGNPPGTPSKLELTENLKSMTEPLWNCWSSQTRKDLDECLHHRFEEGMTGLILKKFP